MRIIEYIKAQFKKLKKNNSKVCEDTAKKKPVDKTHKKTRIDN